MRVAMHQYSFAFALILTGALLALYLSRTSNVNWTVFLATFAPLVLAAIASTPAILSGGGGIDVSISPVMILTTALYAVMLAPSGLGDGVSIALLLLIGGAVGAINGLLTVRLRIQPVVVTLATSFAITGINVLLVPAPLFMNALTLADIAGPQGRWPGSLILIGAPFVLWIVLRRTAYLRTLYAVGSSDVTAFASGVNVSQVRILAYAMGGLFAAIGGLAVLATTSSVNASLSGTYTVSAIAAVALGGTSLWGGSGGILGSLLGALSLYLLSALLITLNVDPSWLRVVSGAMLLVAVVVVGVASSQTARSKQRVLE